MSRITLVDSQTAGISGDMLLAALIDAGANLRTIEATLELIPRHFSRCKSLELVVRNERKHGFRARLVDFLISEKDVETTAQELIQGADEIAKASNLSERARSFARASVKLLTDVESKLHGVDISKAHLHEAGSADTLADVFGVAAACDSLKIFEGEVFATPVAVGGGSVTFSHGTIGTPAPAVLEIARQCRIPIKGGPEEVELATPTGMSMLGNLAESFLETYPPVIPETVGYGAGKKELTNSPNILRIVLGHTTDPRFNSETIQVIETNLDDIPGEMLGHALERMLASGAKDAWVTPAIFKKGRPGHVLHAICDAKDVQKLAEVMIMETGTLGVRFQNWSRFILQREVKSINVEIAGRKFNVRVKFAKDRSGKKLIAKPEFEDLRSIAETLSMPAREVSAIVMREAIRVDAKNEKAG